jgi:hypothetical protein
LQIIEVVVVNTGIEESPIWGASRSLKKICDDNDDLVGLIAYGLYKQEMSQWADEAKPTRDEVDKQHLTLQNKRVEGLRSQAKEILYAWIEGKEDEWRNDLFNEIKNNVAKSVGDEVEKAVTNRLATDISEIRKSTNLSSAIKANLIAWLITLAISATLVIGLFNSSIIDSVASFVKPKPISTEIKP